MAFIWPPLLLLLLAIPVGVWVYRRAGAAAARGGRAGSGSAAARRRAARRATAARAAPRRRWVRRIPAACTVVGITILVMSLARPQTVIGVPRLEGTVILAFDVSGSMAATDVAPSRLEAAKAAAMELVAHQPASIRIGVVVFSDAGFATQVPTGDRTAIEAAIQRLEPERGTSIARGIQEALTVIRTALDPTTTDYYTNSSAPIAPDPTPVPDGVYEPAIIVLLTDGENTGGVDPLELAQTAQGPRHPHRHRRRRHRGGHDARDRGLQGPHPARRGRPRGDRRSHRRHLLRRRRGRPRARSTTTSAAGSSSAPSRRR